MSLGAVLSPIGRVLDLHDQPSTASANFELYMVDVDGKVSTPIRVTLTQRASMACRSSRLMGRRLSWTTNRTSAKRSQIYHRRIGITSGAREMLGLVDANAIDAPSQAVRESADAAREEADAGFSPAGCRCGHVDYLCRERTGRTPDRHAAVRRMATAYVAAYLDNLGLETGRR